jgi:soluble epoxide hydrolase/lipid-phosphate phosphatase
LSPNVPCLLGPDRRDKTGFGLVVPDLLGYGGTDKPVEPVAYKLKDMSFDLVDILESIEWITRTSIITISHDWYAPEAC